MNYVSPALTICLSAVVIQNLSASEYSDLVVRDEPIAYWRLGETGGSRVRDVMDNHHGRYLSSPGMPVPGPIFKIPGAIAGDDDTAVHLENVPARSGGPSAIVDEHPDLWLHRNDFSIEAWVQPDGLDGTHTILSIGRWHRPNEGGFNWYQSDGKVFFDTIGVDGGGSTEEILSPGNWHHLVVVLDANNLTSIYCNGTAAEIQLAGTNPIRPSGRELSIGFVENGPWDHFLWDGALDEIAYYGKALSPSQVLEHALVGGVRRGNFNCDRRLDVQDIDRLTTEVNRAGTGLSFDVNMDGVVNGQDRFFWVHELFGTFFGDANLDGEFNSGDLTKVFQAGEYEDGIGKNSTWGTGDWNGDGDFTTSDLVAAFQDGGYEAGPRPRAKAVPEPSGLILLAIGIVYLACRRNFGQ